MDEGRGKGQVHSPVVGARIIDHLTRKIGWIIYIYIILYVLYIIILYLLYTYIIIYILWFLNMYIYIWSLYLSIYIDMALSMALLLMDG